MEERGAGRWQPLDRDQVEVLLEDGRARRVDGGVAGGGVDGGGGRGPALERLLECLAAGDQVVVEDVDHLDVLPVLQQQQQQQQQ